MWLMLLFLIPFLVLGPLRNAFPKTFLFPAAVGYVAGIFVGEYEVAHMGVPFLIAALHPFFGAFVIGEAVHERLKRFTK